MPKPDSLVLPEAPFSLTPPMPAQLTPMELLQTVIQTQNPKDAVEVVKELVKLQNDMRMQDAQVAFNQALADCQSEIKLVVNDSEKTSPGGKHWATYRALDKAVRPIWTRKGFCLSFGSQSSPVAEQMISEAYLSLGLYSRTYSVPMDIGGKGPKGDGALSKPHAILAGVEYSRRILLKMIFNIITGDEDQNPEEGHVEQGALNEHLEEMKRCETLEGLDAAFRNAAKQALAVNDLDSYRALNKAKNARKKELKAA